MNSNPPTEKHRPVTTLAQMAQVSGRSRLAIRKALQAQGKLPKREKGVRGLRIDLAVANAVMSHQWPGTPRITLEILSTLTTKKPEHK